MVLSPMCALLLLLTPICILRPLYKTQYLGYGIHVEKCMLISPSFLGLTLILILYLRKASLFLIWTGPNCLLVNKGTLIYYLGSGNKYSSIFWPQAYIPSLFSHCDLPRGKYKPRFVAFQALLFTGSQTLGPLGWNYCLPNSVFST